MGTSPCASLWLLKAEVLAGGGGLPDKDNERFVVTTLRGPASRTLYQQVYCARGQAKNLIKQMKYDLKSDHTSASSFMANFARLLLHLPTACPVKALLAQICRRLYPTNRMRAMLFSMTRHVWPARRCRLPLPTTTSRLTPPAGSSMAMKLHFGEFMQHSG